MLVSNATLTAVLDSSQSLDDYDQAGSGLPTSQPAPTPAQKWAGSVEAYLQEKSMRVAVAGGASEWQKVWRIYLQFGSPPIAFAEDDQITIRQTQPDGSVMTATVPIISVEQRMQPDMPSDVQTLLLICEPSAA